MYSFIVIVSFVLLVLGWLNVFFKFLIFREYKRLIYFLCNEFSIISEIFIGNFELGNFVYFFFLYGLIVGFFFVSVNLKCM